MRTIHKWHLGWGRHVEPLAHVPIEIPHGANILTIQIQDENHVLWTEDVEGAQPEERVFCAVFTGQQVLSKHYKYISTVQDAVGLVWHWYEFVNK